MGSKKFEFILSAKTTGFSNSFSRATKGLNTFNKEISASNRAAKELEGGLVSMAGKFGAIFGGLSLSLFTKSIWDAGVAMQGLRNSFKAITGSSRLAAQEIDFVRQASDTLGLRFETTIDAYKGLAAAAKGTILAGKTTRDIFLGIGEASTVLGINAEQSAGALLAVSQMISKGKVSAEELRGQLGERLPGAFQLAAEAMGVTTAELDKMMSSGELMAEDFLPAFARALHERFGQAAVEASDSAIAALNRFQNGWMELKNGIAESGFLDLATGKINELTAAMTNPEVQQKIIDLSTRFFELTESVLSFTVNHVGAIAKVLGGLVALSALSRTLHLITGLWNGLNAALVVMTGMRLAPWLITVKGALETATIAARGFKGVIGSLSGVFLAWEVGFQIGNFLNKFDIVKQAGIAMAAGLTKAWLRAKKAWTWVSQGDVDAVQREMEEAERLYSDMFSEVGNKAQKLATAQRMAHAQAADAAESSANEQKIATAAALAEMENKYKEYADKVLALQDKILGRERSLVEELRAMSRSGMSDLGAWQDRKKEAEEYMVAARNAANAGNADEALQWADKAKAAYKDLNEEVKAGDQVLVDKRKALQSALNGVRSAGELAINILREEKDAAEKAAEAQKRIIDEAKNPQDHSEAIETATKETEKLQDSIIKVGDTWVNVTKETEEAWLQTISKVDKALDQMTIDRTIDLHFNQIESKRHGGLVGAVRKYASGGEVPPMFNKWRAMHTGGRLSGFGGGDRIRALLEAGEFVIRKEAVKKYGMGLFHALNSLRVNTNETIKARLGGLILPQQMQPVGMQSGGMVANQPGTSSATYNLTVQFNGSAGRNKTDMRQQARLLLKEIEKMHREGSR